MKIIISGSHNKNHSSTLVITSSLYKGLLSWISRKCFAKCLYYIVTYTDNIIPYSFSYPPLVILPSLPGLNVSHRHCSCSMARNTPYKCKCVWELQFVNGLLPCDIYDYSNWNLTFITDVMKFPFNKSHCRFGKSVFHLNVGFSLTEINFLRYVSMCRPYIFYNLIEILSQ